VLPFEALAVIVILKAVPAVCGLLIELKTNRDRLTGLALTCILENAQIDNEIRNAIIRICSFFMFFHHHVSCLVFLLSFFPIQLGFGARESLIPRQIPQHVRKQADARDD